MKKKPELSVVLLCYRSEKHVIPFIEQLVNLLTNEKIDFELVMVANYDEKGTPDETPQIVRKIADADPRCVYLAERKTGMMGWDLRAGLQQTRGRLIAFLDGDGQTPPSDIVRLYRLFNAGKIDIGKIYRTQRADSFLRKVVSHFFNFLFFLFFPGKRIRDVNGKPKLMARSAYEMMNLKSNDWFADAEILLEARRLNLNIMEIPGVSGPNRWRKSFLTGSAVLEFCKNLLLYRIRYWR